MVLQEDYPIRAPLFGGKEHARLNRKKGQSILIQTPEGQKIEVHVLDWNGNQVHLE